MLCGIAAAQTGGPPNVDTIIEKSVVATNADFKAAVNYNWTEIDRTASGSKKSRVTMIEGTPYYRLLAVNGKPLSAQQEAEEQKKQEQVAAARRAESPEDRQKRIAKFERERTRDNSMMDQLTKAFDFTLMGTHRVRTFPVYVLRAKPKPGYNPPNMDTQVLRGMEGELWIDEKTFEWVKVTAQVIHPVSIEGFLAQVEPGTRFELDRGPVGNGTSWQATHFAMRSRAKVLFLIERASQEDDTFSDYTPVGK